jgi:hypothetical protein
MFVVISNKPGSPVYGLFASISEAIAWAKHHLVGYSWTTREVCHA